MLHTDSEILISVFINLVIGIFRYASEIDGECIPITAPDGGERVYAKFCRDLGDEPVKKLDVKAKSNGTNFAIKLYDFPIVSLYAREILENLTGAYIRSVYY